MEENTINQRIAGYRKLAGFTQAQAAELLNLKRNTYARMEKYGNPTPDMLKQMAELFRVSVATLIYGKDENVSAFVQPPIPPLVLEQPSFNDILPLSIMETNAIRIFRNLSKTDQQIIVDSFNEVYRNSKKK
ncbi:MAG: helix-turn-helix domain-containing protein [Clostridia bacterium]|nr:helix-turn-helix domain-containing protein [Clostridia bacterium]